MREITKNLYQGNAEDAIRASKNKSVDVIIYLGQEIPHELSHESKVPVIHIPIKDGKDLKSKWNIMCVSIGTFVYKESIALVACRAGLSRSPMAVVYYLCILENFQFDKTYKFVKEKIPEMIPAPDLYNQIKEMLE